ncbi:hypothetical protein [Luteolibacter sp. Populi]|uniref:hypothetical protein n=1 Tax=Luteolibacter sp. Populi TaxID=3230487 RepID=UPI0034661E76
MSGSKKAVGVAVAIILGGCAGWLAGRSGEAATERDTGRIEEVHSRSTPGGGPNRGGGGKGLASLLREMERQAAGGDALDAIERMSNAELRDLLTGSGPLLDAMAWSDARSQFQELVRAAAAELYRREGPASLAWAETRGSRHAFAGLVAAAAANEPVFAKEWVDRYTALHGSKGNMEFSRSAHHGAQGRGAKDLVEVNKLYGEFVEPWSPGFPAGFDFAHYMANLPSTFSGRVPMRYLGADDRATAEKMLLEGLGQKREAWGSLAGFALDGRASIVGEAEAVRWISDLIPKLPEEEKEDFITSLIRSDLPDLRAQALIQNLPEEADRQIVAVNLNMSLRSTGSGVAALRAMEDESRRVAALANTLNALGWPKPPDDPTRGDTVENLQLLMQAAGISEEGQAGLRKIVADRPSP